MCGGTLTHFATIRKSSGSYCKLSSKKYHNGKQRQYYGEREVIGIGSDFKLYNGQEETDCLRYRVKRGPNLGGEGNMTRTSFAAWAKGEVIR